MQPDRAATISAFLTAANWGAAHRLSLAGDASNRRYERLTRSPAGENAVLMDAPPETGESIASFVRIARYLTGSGLSAPAILASDEANGLILLEDLGDDLLSRVVTRVPALERPVYTAAVDLLITLHGQTPPDHLVHYDAPTMTDFIAPAYDWYVVNAPTRKDRTMAELRRVLDDTAPVRPVLVLRDFHAENLLWLPDRAGDARIGLLDFQDAVIGHPAYDLISLTRDARRDVAPALAEHLLDHYIARTGQDPQPFRKAAAAIAVQRNLRILGVFARLSRQFGKPSYIDLIPRVWRHLIHDLSHPGLAALRKAVLADLPEPTPDLLTRLKQTCPTNPSP